MSSCTMFHGPGARRAALEEAARLGRLVAPPIGDDGLKVEDARKVVELMMSVPVGDLIGTIVVGPLDEANPKASDVLLKTLEEFKGDFMQPVLWANDLGDVSQTIRSRCLEKFVAALGVEDDEKLMEGSYKLVEAAVARDYLTLVDTIKKFEKQEVQLMWALSEVLSNGLENPEYRQIWERLRKVAKWKNPFMSEVLLALMGF